jgi:hypothetical protein
MLITPKYMVMSRDQNGGSSHIFKIYNTSFESVEVLNYYIGKTLKNQNSIPGEIKNRVNSGNASYHSVQNHLSSRLLSKNIYIMVCTKKFACCLVLV